MKSRLFSAAFIFILLSAAASAQPIKSPYVFVQSGSDTITSLVLPIPPTSISRVTAKDGHFFITGVQGPERIRFFGTELEYTSQFLSGDDARVLAKRLHKLGFNAVRLIDNDQIWWAAGSLLDYTNANSTTSYNVIPAQLARFDTLLYEFKKQGIYAFLVLNSQHTFVRADGVAQYDSTFGPYFTHFYDKRAAQLHRQWVKTLFSHVNPLTGLKLGEDPVLAAVEVTSPGLSLLAGWRFNYINWIDNNNTYKAGGTTLAWNHSRRLDTLFSQYLLRKYGSDAAISNAWKGGSVVNAPNVVGNGSFEQVGSTSWSFALNGGATGAQSLFSPGADSQYCMLALLADLSPKPTWTDAYLLNSTPRLGKDTLYELSFYAKIRYNAQKPVLNREVQVYIQDFQYGTGSLAANPMIDTAWTKYSFIFRALAGGLQRLYLGIGQQMGDVMFDAVSIKRKEEYGLFPTESSALASIVRLKFGEPAMLPRQRFRDIALFYDSLQTDYFTAIKKCIVDTIKSPVLVNFYCPEWWGTVMDHYSNRFSDFAQAHINTDYAHGRTGGPPYTDSTWVMLNNSMLSDRGNYAMGYLASASIEGKPFIGRYMGLAMNQYAPAQVPMLTSYASLQDWDGLFFINYATYYEDLFLNYSRLKSWWTIAGNPSLLVQMPVASEAFRNQRIKAAPTTVTLKHDEDDVLLESIPGHYSHPMGAEGYLDPNIATKYKIRQQFNSPVHKIAQEYPYLRGDTATKVSETEELKWSQSGSYLLVDANGFSAAVGIFGADTVRSGNLKFRRLDDARDLQSILLSKLPNSSMLLTIAGRSQNFGALWQFGDSSIGNHWGKAPTIMSAGKFEFFVNSDSNRVLAYPLDTSGNVTKTPIEGVKISGTNTFMIAVNQAFVNSPWFWIQGKNDASAVLASGTNPTEITVNPNPARNETHIKLSLANSGRIKISLFDDLGREIANIANGDLYQGSYDLPVDVSELAAGHYVLRVDCGGQVLSRSMNVIR